MENKLNGWCPHGVPGGSLGDCAKCKAAAEERGTIDKQTTNSQSDAVAALISEIYAINPPRDFSREEVIVYLQRAAKAHV